MTGFAKNAIVKLLVELGAACSDYQDRSLRDLPCERLQLDEIWSFVYAMAKNVPEERAGEFGCGDVWTWTAIDADTKLVPSFLIAGRDEDAARMFTSDLAGRLAHRVQLTTDGHRPSLRAVKEAFGADVDFAQFIKICGMPESQDASPTARRYSPVECTGTEIRVVQGDPNPDHISANYAECQSFTMRMSKRRFTRLTNGSSRKVENLAAAVALHFMWYNFARPHSSLGRNVTPAVAAGVSDHVWTAEEIAALLD